MGNFIGSIGGKKFVVALLGLIAVVVSAKTGIDIKAETLDTIVTAIGTIAGAYVIGQGVADGLSGGKTSSVVQNQKQKDDDKAQAQAQSQDVG